MNNKYFKILNKKTLLALQNHNQKNKINSKCQKIKNKKAYLIKVLYWQIIFHIKNNIMIYSIYLIIKIKLNNRQFYNKIIKKKLLLITLINFKNFWN